jgi:hypothetical protein
LQWLSDSRINPSKNCDKSAAKTKFTLQQQTKLLNETNSTSKTFSKHKMLDKLALSTLCAHKIHNTPTLKLIEANKEPCLFYGLSEPRI